MLGSDFGWGRELSAWKKVRIKGCGLVSGVGDSHSEVHSGEQDTGQVR